jgi:hypothetical protein
MERKSNKFEGQKLHSAKVKAAGWQDAYRKPEGGGLVSVSARYGDWPGGLMPAIAGEDGCGARRRSRHSHEFMPETDYGAVFAAFGAGRGEAKWQEASREEVRSVSHRLRRTRSRQRPRRADGRRIESRRGRREAGGKGVCARTYSASLFLGTRTEF